MAMRLLLTVVALLAGLVVQLNPAQARVRAAGASEIGTLAAEVRGEHAAVSRSLPSVRPDNGRWRESRCGAVMVAVEADCARPVILGVDRAHE
jgi:hypothetical protein